MRAQLVTAAAVAVTAVMGSGVAVAAAGSTATVKVPAVWGLPYHTAADRLRAAGLHQVPQFRPHSPGFYVQDVEPGLNGGRVKAGTVIHLSITRQLAKPLP